MKLRVQPWKLKMAGIVLAACHKVRPNLSWAVSAPSPRSDDVLLRVSDDMLDAELTIDLRLIYREGKRHCFAYFATQQTLLMDQYYAKHDARREAVST